MAIYPVIHKETGEQKEVTLSVHEWDQWKEDNPDWQRDWRSINLSSTWGVGEWRDKLVAKNPGWNDVLRKSIKSTWFKSKENLSMARRKRSSAEQPIGVGLTAKQMKRKKPLSQEYLIDIDPLLIIKNVFLIHIMNKHIVAYGCAGTGKTFITLYNALRDVLSENTPYERIYLVRSLVATREIGFLPGSHEDKADIYQIPYKNMVKYMFQMPSDADFEMLYGNLKSQESIKFWSTSFLRGTTLDNAIVIVDEFQNLNFHELDSIITRVGENTKICFCGDARQSDLQKDNEKNGIH
jgi:predicted ribonuclease YlaK